jgi:hypothetical protein
MAILMLATLVLLAVLIVGGIIAVWSVSGGGDTHATKAAYPETPSWIVGNWNPRDDTKLGINPNIVYSFTSDWKVTQTSNGESVATGRFQLPNLETLIIDWQGTRESYKTNTHSSDGIFTLTRLTEEPLQLRKAPK